MLHMSSINGIGNTAGSNQVQKVVAKPIQKEIAAADAANTAKTDKVELSDSTSSIAAMLKTLKSGGDVRADKVAAVKAQIEAGTYETDDKLNVAADRLLDDLVK